MIWEGDGREDHRGFQNSITCWSNDFDGAGVYDASRTPKSGKESAL